MSNLLIDRLMQLVNEQTGGKHTVFAKKAGIPTSTFQGYMQGRDPHVEHLLRLRETYGVNTDWLLSGKGPTYIEEVSQATNPPDTEEPVNIPELRDMTTVVLESNTIYRAALAANVRAFYRAVKNEDEKMEMQEQLTRIEAKHDADMQELKKMIMAMREPEKKEKAA